VTHEGDARTSTENRYNVQTRLRGPHVAGFSYLGRAIAGRQSVKVLRETVSLTLASSLGGSFHSGISNKTKIPVKELLYDGVPPWEVRTSWCVWA
jgi:hypothetical protein